jgi:DNA-binding transcriptional LysR family regulator
LLGDFRKEHPGVDISVIQCEMPIDEVRGRRLDVGIVATTPDYWVRPVLGLSLFHLFTDAYAVALPMDHAYAARDTIALTELTNERWITTRSDEDPSHILLLRSVRADVRISARTDDYTVTGSWVAAGLGIALVPQLAVPRLGKDVALVAPTEPVARDVSAIVLADGSSATATAFVRHLR